MTDHVDFWQNRFHWYALAAGFLAHGEGWLAESEYVRQLAYTPYAVVSLVNYIAV